MSAALSRAWDYTKRDYDRPAFEDGSAVLNDSWRRITEQDYWYCLEVLPPIYVPGGFAVSEPVTSTDSGEVVYLVVLGGPKTARARLATLAQVGWTPPPPACTACGMPLDAKHDEHD